MSDFILDKKWFIMGVALSSKKATLTDEVSKPLYKKNTLNSREATEQTAVTTAGIAISQITSGANHIVGPAVSLASSIGNATAAEAISWTEEQISYSTRNRLTAYCMDNSAFISRLLHTVIPDDTDYATGNTGYADACTYALDLWQLVDYCVSTKDIVAVNSTGEELQLGDLIFFSENKTNSMLFHVTDVAVYVGSNMLVKASRKAGGVVETNLDPSNVVLVARPNLVLAGEEGITITDDMIGLEKYSDDITEYLVPVFVDNMDAYCTTSE